MIINYLITAFRTLRRNKVSSLINVLGLSIGISAALIIYLIVQYDFSFEQFRKDKDNTYRVVTMMSFSNSTFPNSGVPYPIIDAARKEVHGIEASANIFAIGAKAAVPKLGAAPVIVKHVYDLAYADSHYFDVFPDYQWLAGSPSSLDQLYHVVLSQDRANIYFPGLSPSQAIGKTIIYDDSLVCTVTGIVKDVKENTDLVFKVFISLPTLKRSANSGMTDPDWGSVTSSNQFYVRLEKGTSPLQVEQQLATLRKIHSDDAKDTANKAAHKLQPFTDIHFTGPYDNYGQRQASKPVLYGLLVVAAFLLTLGSINFINLATAQAGKRAKEIGIRKTMGSSRRQLVLQFLGEAFLLTLISTLLSLAVTPWLMKLFSDFIPKNLHFNLKSLPHIYLFLGALILTVSLLSGFYPARVLSRFSPVIALKNQAWSGKSSTRNAILRQSLTAFQFVIAQVFIIGTLIVGSQIHYFLDKDMGFKKEAIIFFNTPYAAPHLQENCALLMNKLHKIPGIAELSLGASPPASNSVNSEIITYMDGKKEIRTDVQIMIVDTAYMHLYGLKLLAGHNVVLCPDSARQLVINRTYAGILGLTDPRQALGKTLNKNKDRIIGIMEDFHQASFHKAIRPMAFVFNKAALNQSIHIALPNSPAGRASWKATIAAAEKAYKEVFPGEDFEYTFLDESIAKFYTAEQHMSSLLRWATGLTIFISCLGLLGLVIYSTSLRTKEIGVRKVLGASVTQIVSLLSKDFVKLVCIAFAIAVPIAWYGAHRWMESFVYRATISWWTYALSGLTMLLIALLTLSIQTIRAANANPVESLRTE
ncbi:ABC transporter permease [Flavitalea sp. BT771]|uniref:FtsX-like permease family protein n=1 Tax=Flavitalea sp. BT771 TaxID=3063329 RepID=UPI0026E3D69E|nr:FtsX-like permease family protein [Flavitalea sp. BT771]MDO6431821.1 ABC transporter permease [Flavitalea sp. BT771]MDV6220730.1 FtsX-like permease family protein [Flavitalea sp. BT771]